MGFLISGRPIPIISGVGGRPLIGYALAPMGGIGNTALIKPFAQRRPRIARFCRPSRRRPSKIGLIGDSRPVKNPPVT